VADHSERAAAVAVSFPALNRAPETRAIRAKHDTSFETFSAQLLCDAYWGGILIRQEWTGKRHPVLGARCAV
jgi:hypothetical protein